MEKSGNLPIYTHTPIYTKLHKMGSTLEISWLGRRPTPDPKWIWQTARWRRKSQKVRRRLRRMELDRPHAQIIMFFAMNDITLLFLVIRNYYLLLGSHSHCTLFLTNLFSFCAQFNFALVWSVDVAAVRSGIKSKYGFAAVLISILC